MEHNVLWTSGWDSTYRILDLVLYQKKTVQPYYILDNDRVSTKIELETMEKIKAMIYELQPDARNRIKETITCNKEEIPNDNKITSDYESLAQTTRLGRQYDWLARFVKSNNISKFELCSHKDDNVGKLVGRDVVVVEGNDVFQLRENRSHRSLDLFTYFTFPVFEISKLDMERFATEKGFNHIMYETWFCHSPINNKACGICYPCKFTRAEGLGRRVPRPTLKNKAIIFGRKVKKKLLR